jgi:hypothetical protein
MLQEKEKVKDKKKFLLRFFFYVLEIQNLERKTVEYI